MEMTSPTPTATPKPTEEPTPKPSLPLTLKNTRSPRVRCIMCQKLGTQSVRTENGKRVLYFEHTDENSHRAPSGRLMGKFCRAGILEDVSGLTEAIALGTEIGTNTNRKIEAPSKASKWPIGHCVGCNRDNMPLRYNSKVVKKGRLCVNCYAKEHKILKGQKGRKDKPDPLNKTVKKKTGPKVKRGRGRPRSDYKIKYLALKAKYDRIIKAKDRITKIDEEH